MPEIQIIVLAIVQGITEFLPISSSGHLAALSPLMGWQDQGLAFDVSVHAGTLMAVMIYCRQEIIAMLQGILKALISFKMNDGLKLALLLILATLPVVVVGFLARDWVAGAARNLTLIGSTSIIFGLVLGLADRYSSRMKGFADLKYSSAFIIGCSQIIALIPGTSRSGITMSAALWLGFDRLSSARFSFLLSIPTILGAVTLILIKIVSGGDGDNTLILNYETAIILLTGALLSGVTALLAMGLLMAWLKKSGVMPFVIYRVLLGIGLIIYQQFFMLAS